MNTGWRQRVQLVQRPWGRRKASAPGVSWGQGEAGGLGHQTHLRQQGPEFGVRALCEEEFRSGLT